MSPSRQLKQTLPTLYNEETISNVQEEKRKQIKIKEHEEKNHWKQKDDQENNKSNEINQNRQAKIKSKYSNKNILFISSAFFFSSFSAKDTQESIPSKLIYKRQSQYEQNDANGGIYRDENRQRRTSINDFNRNTINERYGSGQSSSTISKTYDNNNNINRRQQRNIDPIHIHRSDGTQKSKATKPIVRNKTQNNNSKYYKRFFKHLFLLFIFLVEHRKKLFNIDLIILLIHKLVHQKYIFKHLKILQVELHLFKHKLIIIVN